MTDSWGDAMARAQNCPPWGCRIELPDGAVIEIVPDKAHCTAHGLYESTCRFCRMARREQLADWRAQGWSGVTE